MGALTYISGLVVLTADRTLAVGPFEEPTHQLENIFFTKNFPQTSNYDLDRRINLRSYNDLKILKMSK